MHAMWGCFKYCPNNAGDSSEVPCGVGLTVCMAYMLVGSSTIAVASWPGSLLQVTVLCGAQEGFPKPDLCRRRNQGA